MTNYVRLEQWKESLVFDSSHRIHAYIGGEQMRTSFATPYWPPFVEICHVHKASWWKEERWARNKVKGMWVVGWPNLSAMVTMLVGRGLLSRIHILIMHYDSRIDGIEVRGGLQRPPFSELFDTYSNAATVWSGVTGVTYVNGRELPIGCIEITAADVETSNKLATRFARTQLPISLMYQSQGSVEAASPRTRLILPPSWDEHHVEQPAVRSDSIINRKMRQ